ncbi:MAG: UxaA family hydrolase, partial [Gammaproteobacteria bacterium]|nr:UxaA family hydrolase [Gammaproteobacteria bacterium]
MTTLPGSIPFSTAARVPAPGDNVAIAVKRLVAGTRIEHGRETFTLPHTVLEGHRFVLQPIAAGARLSSWGLPFGTATRDLMPGEYVCNQSILDVLAERSIDVDLPDEPVFEDYLETYTLDEQHFEAGEQVAQAAAPLTFAGYPRAGRRGVGTRNFIIVLATTSHSTAFAEALAKRFEGANNNTDFDGVVAVTHTEGGGAGKPNNLEFVLRTLAGFIVHPNVGAALVVNYATQSYGNDDVREFMRVNDYPLDDVP